MIGVVDYGMGNLKSVFNAFDSIGADVKLINSAKQFEGLTHLVIPGVGAFSKAMENLEFKKLIQPILAFKETGMPILGICLGMQLMATLGFEPDEKKGLDLIAGEVIKFENLDFRVPHVGWNSIELKREHYLFNGVKNGVDFYFVHSFYFNVKNENDVLAYCDYGLNFPAVVQKENLIGIQFHPEKSQKNGLKVLENFCFGGGNA